MTKDVIYCDFNKTIAAERIGGKAYNLRHLSKWGFLVPKWFCLTTNFFRAFLGDYWSEYQNLLKNYSEQNRQEVIKLIKKQTFSAELKTAVNEQLQDFGQLAVRSSATDEDGANYSFAGMMESYLNVLHEDVFATIKRCFISTFSTRAMEYRLRNKLPLAQIMPAVVVMEMVPAEVAGVIFTTNPRTNNPDEILISAVKGLGESLVSGEQDSQDFVVDMENQLIKPVNAILDENTVVKLADLARKVEKSYKRRQAQDIEFAIRNGEIYLLQARPIATYARIDKDLPRTILDNSNIIESYSGVTTPLTFSFAQEVYGKIYHQTLRNFGIEKSAIEALDDELNHMLCFYENKVYYNLNNWYQMTALYPGYNKNKKYMENMMGVKVSLNDSHVYQNTRTARIYLRFARKMLRMRKDSVKFLDKFHQVTDPLRGQDFVGKSNRELLQIYNNLETEIIDDFTTPIANDMGAMVFYGLLTDKIKRAKILHGDGLASDIFSQQGGVESMKPTTELLAITAEIRDNAKLCELFKTTSIANLKQKLRQNKLPIFQKLNQYIADYGARSMEELKLETITMAQDPSFLFQTIKQYLESNIETSLPKKQAKTESTEELLSHYKGLNKFYVEKLLNITKYFIRNRELLRLQRTYIYDIARSIFVRFGYNFKEAGIIGSYRDIFFLEKNEIFQIARTKREKIDVAYWKTMIRGRKREYEQNKDKLVYERMYFYGEVTPKNMLPVYSAQEVADEPGVLRGVAGGGAVKTGVVQYITDPSQTVRENAILMAKRTDPGWVVLFPLAKAVIIERGSILSHSAVVAREMGKTLVVGVRGLTDKIHDGDKVEVDGINGTIRVLDE